MTGMLNAEEGDYLLWNIERTITKIYIPVLLDSCMNDKGTKDLLTKVNSLHLIGIEYVFHHTFPKYINTSCTCMLQNDFLDNLGEERASSLSKIFHKLFTRGRVGLE